MPELLIVRHAKSDWNASFEHDRERPLNDRGRRSAVAIGRLLALVRRIPDLAITSPAVRARSTIEIAAAAGDWPTTLRVDERLYGGGVDATVETLREIDPAVEKVAVVGHEPTWSSLVSGLIGGANVRVPTGAVIAVDVPPWPQVGWGAARLEWMIVPRLLTDGDLDLAGP